MGLLLLRAIVREELQADNYPVGIREEDEPLQRLQELRDEWGKWSRGDVCYEVEQQGPEQSGEGDGGQLYVVAEEH